MKNKPKTMVVTATVMTLLMSLDGLAAKPQSFKDWKSGKGYWFHKETNSSYGSGGIGLGTWNTQVLYRNIRVTSPDGKILYQTKKADISPDMAYFTGNLKEKHPAAYHSLIT